MMNQRGSPCGEAGQTLLEILLAFSVSILVLSGIIMGITTSLNNAQYTKNQSLANSYAQEGMAVVRRLRDNSSWSNFLTQTGGCLTNDLTTFASYDGTNCSSQKIANTIFGRHVEIVQGDSSHTDCSDGSNSIYGSKVTVTVSWPDSKCPIGNPYCHNVQLVTCFSQIK